MTYNEGAYQVHWKVIDLEQRRCMAALPTITTAHEAEIRNRFLNSAYVIEFFAVPGGRPTQGVMHTGVSWPVAAADQAYMEYAVGYACAVVPLAEYRRVPEMLLSQRAVV